MKLRKNEMKLPKNEIKVPKNEIKVPKNEIISPEEFLHASVENEKSPQRNPRFPPFVAVRPPVRRPRRTLHSALPPDFPRISETSLFSLMCF